MSAPTAPAKPSSDPPSPRGTAERIVARAPVDLVFTMRFLGESQEILHSHFRRFLEARFAEQGINPVDQPLLPFFIDTHAVELRDFVATGVALARPFRLGEIEILTGDVETLMRVDIWDALASHIDMAERRFSAGIAKVVAALTEADADIRRANP